MFKPKAETILETPTKSVSTVVDTVNWLPTHEHVNNDFCHFLGFQSQMFHVVSWMGALPMPTPVKAQIAAN